MQTKWTCKSYACVSVICVIFYAPMMVLADNAVLSSLQKDFLDTCRVTEQCVTEYQRRCISVMKEAFPKCDSLIIQGGAAATEQYADCLSKVVTEPLEKLSLKEEYMNCSGGSKRPTTAGSAGGQAQYFTELSFNVDSIVTYPDPLSACRAGAENARKWTELQHPEMSATYSISKTEQQHEVKPALTGDGVVAYKNIFDRPVQDYGVCIGKAKFIYKSSTTEHKKGTVLENEHEDRIYTVYQ
jgi:hypothetical protein